MAALAFSLEAAQFGDFQYEVSAGMVTITGYTGPGGNVSIPDSIADHPVSSIGEWAFYDCTSLTSITIPDSVTVIEGAAFYHCTSLTTVTIPDSVNSIRSMYDGIGFLGAFESCSALTRVIIGSGTTSIADEAFLGCWSLTAIEVDGLNPAYSSREGVLFNKHQDALLRFPSGKAGANYLIPDGVRSIGAGAFSGGTSLTSVTIPDGLTSIGKQAFEHCRSLTSITIPDSVTVVEGGAFHACTSLTAVTIPDNVTRLRSLPALASWLYPTGVFAGCTALTSVTIGSSVTELGEATFDGCTKLTSVIIPDRVTTIGAWAFSGCTSLSSLSIGEGVKTIGGGAFWGCSRLTTVVIPGSVTSIGSVSEPSEGLRCPNPIGAFQGCTGLTSVTLPDSVTSISYKAFAGCTSLTRVTLPDSITWIPCRMFDRCTRLTSITIPQSVSVIGGGAFHECTSLTTITIPDGVSSISSVDEVNLCSWDPIGAFSGCTSLTSVTVGASVTEVGRSTFQGCSRLASAYLHGNPNLGYCDAPGFCDGAFDGCPAVTLYYRPGIDNWSATVIGYPTALWIPLTLGDPPLPGDALKLLSSSPAPATLRVQRSTNLRDWEDWQTVSRDAGPGGLNDPETATVSYRFYRVVED